MPDQELAEERLIANHLGYLSFYPIETPHHVRGGRYDKITLLLKGTFMLVHATQYLLWYSVTQPKCTTRSGRFSIQLNRTNEVYKISSYCQPLHHIFRRQVQFKGETTETWRSMALQKHPDLHALYFCTILHRFEMRMHFNFVRLWFKGCFGAHIILFVSYDVPCLVLSAGREMIFVIL